MVLSKKARWEAAECGSFVPTPRSPRTRGRNFWDYKKACFPRAPGTRRCTRQLQGIGWCGTFGCFILDTTKLARRPSMAGHFFAWNSSPCPIVHHAQ